MKTNLSWNGVGTQTTTNEFLSTDTYLVAKQQSENGLLYPWLAVPFSESSY